jgi:Mg2+/Co2+ transporter CorB
MQISDFTEQELKTIHRVMSHTWDYIGMDMLQSIADSKGIKRERVTVPKADVIEIVLDANYMDEFFRKPEEKQLLKKFRQLSYADKIKVGEQAFTYNHYGM